MKLRLSVFVAIFALACAFLGSPAQDKKPKKDVIPHGQTSMPGPALSPAEALKKFQVPPGFRVELVAAEPNIINPVAMTFDERGRIWITESLEYPKKAAGPGKDRVKVLESTKGDGNFDKITTVIEGLNIPSGIAVGHGGVWLANAPDILFYPFEDFANVKLGKPQVVVTGFGRFDTHELPNSLTWGPDGWLYGLNGVFNRSVVKQDGKTFDFTCALFKIHPKTKKFELFCEGTSNPWGLAFNDNGDAFVSACVIDHLWHLTETGYYHRQGGPYPPYTWKIGSIVKHKHQKAAYCGLCWFDSDAYPPEYRGKLYMGNIHGNAINCDQLEKDGATYAAKPGLTPPANAGGSQDPKRGPQDPKRAPHVSGGSSAEGVGPGSNFLLANDPWFMPVVQKVGPDGCLYILDWYDRYHCYQDANRDPAGIDRLKGRLYRVVYGDYKPAGRIDLSKESNEKLIERLGSANIFFRESAQRGLVERLTLTTKTTVLDANELKEMWDRAGIKTKIELLVESQKTPRKQRLHALWASSSIAMIGHPNDPDATVRAWSIRAAATHNHDVPKDLAQLVEMAKDRSPDVQLQVAIAARKLKGVDPLPVLLDVLTHCGDDKLIPHVVWQNLHPLLEKDGERFLALAAKTDLAKSPGLAKVLPRAIDRILGNTSGDPAAVVGFVEKLMAKDKDSPTAALCLAGLSTRIINKEMPDKQIAGLRKQFGEKLIGLQKSPTGPLAYEATLLLASLGEPEGIQNAGALFKSAQVGDRVRVRALETLVRMKELDPIVLPLEEILRQKHGTAEFRGQLLSALTFAPAKPMANLVLSSYGAMEPELQPKAIELLTQNADWAKNLFREIAEKKISKDVVNVNQARRLLATRDKDLMQLVEKHWGIPRETRNPAREKVAQDMKELFVKSKGDPVEGKNVFKRVCAQCHRIYGGGVDVGPDVTSNGRADFDQLVSNIFDPSLVIGSGYQAVIVNTKQGQVLTGLLVEDNPQRVVLKVQGGELKTIPRGDVDEQIRSKLSMMPEDLEKQLRPQEIVDLLEYLSLDRPPEDAKAKRIPGTPR